METGYRLSKKCFMMICLTMFVTGSVQPLYAQSAAACPCYNENQLKGLFTPIVQTGGTVRCQKSAPAGSTFVSIYGSSVNNQSGLMRSVIAAAQQSSGAHFCYISPPQKGVSPEHYIQYRLDLTETEAGECVGIIENAVQVLGGTCVVQD